MSWNRVREEVKEKVKEMVRESQGWGQEFDSVKNVPLSFGEVG